MLQILFEKNLLIMSVSVIQMSSMLWENQYYEERAAPGVMGEESML